MSEYDLHQIDQITVERNFHAGEIIIQEQTKAAGFFIIDSGKVEISKKFSDGEEMVLGIHSDGEFFGEMALLDEGLRSATARALIPTRILEISSRDFKNLLYKAPVLGYSIVKEMSSRLRETGALMISYLQRKNRELSQAYLDTVTVIVQNIEARRIGNTTGRTNNCCCRCF
ncbi:hypothetical protein LCGC14_2016330 [marine sediment metagenome]|uniref:Cyclic nucleotide-binding domain-containing protein n=1 Tax=marine sediment metagenome TaxID=412755 RepID=A0A0F9EZ18_9ZZZZ